MSETQRLLGSAGQGHPELVARAAAILSMFDLPATGEDGKLAAACAAAGCLLVDMVAKAAVTNGLMAPSTGAAVEGLVARTIEAWSALALEVVDDQAQA